MRDTYGETRARLETYFDRTAAKTWERLTSDAPVSRIRQTVREGRDAMRASILSSLPQDLSGARVLDAGCGTGAMSEALALRGAEVVAVDISPSLLKVAQARIPAHLHGQITFSASDMADPTHGQFDFVIAMDSLIHYAPGDVAKTLLALQGATRTAIHFTIAPRTALLSAMHMAGKLFPKSDRSPAIVPIAPSRLEQELAGCSDWRLLERACVSSGFYISQAMEFHA